MKVIRLLIGLASIASLATSSNGQAPNLVYHDAQLLYHDDSGTSSAQPAADEVWHISAIGNGTTVAITDKDRPSHTIKMTNAGAWIGPNLSPIHDPEVARFTIDLNTGYAIATVYRVSDSPLRALGYDIGSWSNGNVPEHSLHSDGGSCSVSTDNAGGLPNSFRYLKLTSGLRTVKFTYAVRTEKTTSDVWVDDGQPAPTSKEGHIWAIAIKLTGENAKLYTLTYESRTAWFHNTPAPQWNPTVAAGEWSGNMSADKNTSWITQLVVHVVRN